MSARTRSMFAQYCSVSATAVDSTSCNRRRWSRARSSRTTGSRLPARLDEATTRGPAGGNCDRSTPPRGALPCCVEARVSAGWCGPARLGVRFHRVRPIPRMVPVPAAHAAGRRCAPGTGRRWLWRRLRGVDEGDRVRTRDERTRSRRGRGYAARSCQSQCSVWEGGKGCGLATASPLGGCDGEHQVPERVSGPPRNWLSRQIGKPVSAVNCTN